jgi:hypothetical protein
LKKDVMPMALKFLWLHVCRFTEERRVAYGPEVSVTSRMLFYWRKTCCLWPWSFCDFTYAVLLKKDVMPMAQKFLWFHVCCFTKERHDAYDPEVYVTSRMLFYWRETWLLWVWSRFLPRVIISVRYTSKLRGLGAFDQGVWALVMIIYGSW